MHPTKLRFSLILLPLCLFLLLVIRMSSPPPELKKSVTCDEIKEKDGFTTGDTRYIPPSLAVIPPDTQVCGPNTTQGLTFFVTKLSEKDLFAFYTETLSKMGCSILGITSPNISSEIANSLNFRCKTGFGYILTYKDENKYSVLYNTLSQ